MVFAWVAVPEYEIMIDFSQVLLLDGKNEQVE
jgi:hypothetical protein